METRWKHNTDKTENKTEHKLTWFFLQKKPLQNARYGSFAIARAGPRRTTLSPRAQAQAV
jgi:hypothetical protein